MTKNTLSEELFLSCIPRNSDAIRFDKRGIQRRPVLIKKAAQAIANDICGDIGAVCILGTSGIALGVNLAHVLDVPIYFYRSAGWGRQEDGSPPYFLPKPNVKQNVVIADSHYRSAQSLRLALARIDEFTSWTTVAVALVFEPDINSSLTNFDTPIISYLRSSENIDFLKETLHCSNFDELKNVLEARSSFWKRQEAPTVENPGHRLRNIRAYISRTKNKMPDFTQLHLSQKLRSRLRLMPRTDQGIWDYYQQPDLVRESMETVGNSIDLSEFKYLIGVSALGSSLAFSLVYHNSHIMEEAKIFSAYMDKELLPVPDPNEIENTRGLLAQLRLTSGFFISHAMNLVSNHNGNCDTALVVVGDLSIEPKRRQRPLTIAGGKGLDKIYVLDYTERPSFSLFDGRNNSNRHRSDIDSFDR